MRFWWVCWRLTQMWWITFWEEKHHSEWHTHKHARRFTCTRSAVSSSARSHPYCSPLWTAGAPTCCRQRSPTPWASAIPPVTPTRRPVARCPLMTTTPRSWASGEGSQEARAASSFSVSQGSTAWWGRWPAGAESLELTLGVPKVSFWLMTLSCR